MNDDDLREQNQKHLLGDTRIQKEIERKPIADRSTDPASQLLLSKAAKEGIETAWDRYEAQQTQCGFGELGICCRICLMGPCRIDPLENGPKKGVCGATADMIVARNLLRMIAAGAAAHSDHGREVTEVLHLASQGKIAGYEVKDEKKLSSLATEFGIEVQPGKSRGEVARDVAEAILDEFGTRKGYIKFIDRVPQKRRDLWNNLGITPRGIDREIVEIMHRTHIGVDSDYISLILQGLRASLSDGWGGSMAATELSDVLFGTPKIKTCQSNLGVLKADMVNII